MKNTRIALLGLLALISAFAQTSNYPGALDTNATLFVAKDNVQTQLNAAMAVGDTVAVVKSNTNWAVNMIATVESEQMLVTAVSGNNLTVTRAFGGTTAAAHAANKTFSNYVNAAYQSSAKSAILAIETALGPGLANLSTAPTLNAAQYNFTAQSPGGSLIIGSNVITLTPVPLGVNGTNTSHYLYISGGTGTAEAGLITGGTAVSGAASGTVILTLANTHSGAWTIKSATAGIQEAVRTVPVTDSYAYGPAISIPAGKFPIYATIRIDNYASLLGAGSNSTILQKAFSSGDLLYIGDSTTTLSAIAAVYKDFCIEPLTGVVDTGGYAINVRYRYNPTIMNVALYGDGNTGRIKNGIKFDSCQTFNLLNTKILWVTNIGLEVTATNPDQATGRIVAVDVTSPPSVSATNDLVYFHGNILSMFIDGLQMQGGGKNWKIDTTGGAFSESQISNVIFDSAAGTAFSLAGTGNTFKLNFNNICLSTIAGVPSMLGMVFDGTGAGVFSQITVNNLTGGVNANNQIGTALFLLSASNFLLSNSHLQGSGAGTGDVAIQIQGTTNNVVLSGNLLGYAYDGSIVGSQAYRGIYIPSGTHSGMTITGNRIYGSSAALQIAGAHTTLQVTGNSLAGGATSSFTGTGTAYFDNSADPAGLNGRMNYIATEGGANNAITGTLSGATLAAGLQVRILLAHTLQAGANTFALNGGTAVAIKSHLNVANNIGTAYAVGSVVNLWYDGTRFQDLGQ